MLRVLRRVYQVLEELGYRPVVIGTYALILQGWLPPYYEAVTKDVDVYVDDPMIVFEETLYERLASLNLRVGRSESGGIYIDASKPIEIIYPVFDFHVPRKLLGETVIVRKLRVLEGHAVLVAKALGSNITGLADYIYRAGVKIDKKRLTSLLHLIAGEIEEYKIKVAERRIKAFLDRYEDLEHRRKQEKRWEVMNN